MGCVVTHPLHSGMMWNSWVDMGIGKIQEDCHFRKNKGKNRLKLIINIVLNSGVTMVKISKSRNQYRITIPPEIITAFGLDVNKEYDWVMMGGLPALRERK